MKFNPIGFTEHFPSLKMTLAFGEVSLLKLIALTAGYGITIFAGSPIVFVVCRGFKVEEITRGIKGAGKYIGYFERFLESQGNFATETTEGHGKVEELTL